LHLSLDLLRFAAPLFDLVPRALGERERPDGEDDRSCGDGPFRRWRPPVEPGVRTAARYQEDEHARRHGRRLTARRLAERNEVYGHFEAEERKREAAAMEG